MSGYFDPTVVSRIKSEMKNTLEHLRFSLCFVFLLRARGAWRRKRGTRSLIVLEISLCLQTKKPRAALAVLESINKRQLISHETKFNASSSGGDEENRTPVRKHCLMGFSERSLCFALRIKTPADRLLSSDSTKVSLSSLRKSALRYPAFVLLSAQAGAKRKEAGVKPPERSLRLLLCLNKSFTLLTGW